MGYTLEANETSSRASSWSYTVLLHHYYQLFSIIIIFCSSPSLSSSSSSYSVLLHHYYPLFSIITIIFMYSVSLSPLLDHHHNLFSIIIITSSFYSPSLFGRRIEQNRLAALERLKNSRWVEVHTTVAVSVSIGSYDDDDDDDNDELWTVGVLFTVVSPSPSWVNRYMVL